MIVERVKAEKNDAMGFNAESEQFEDLVKAGVIDPAKVARTALQNAASIAALMLTTEALVSLRRRRPRPCPAAEWVSSRNMGGIDFSLSA